MFSDTLTAKDTRGSGRDLVIALHASDVSARVFPPLPSNPAPDRAPLPEVRRSSPSSFLSRVPPLSQIKLSRSEIRPTHDRCVFPLGPNDV